MAAADNLMTALEIASSSVDDPKMLNPIKDFRKCAQNHPQRMFPIDILDTANNEHEISVVSWNILSETWYAGWDGKPMIANDRREKTKEWLARLVPTGVIVLQEVDYEAHESWLAPFMASLDYGTMMQKCKGNHCGICICWSLGNIFPFRNQSFSRAIAVELKNNNDQAVTIVGVHLESRSNGSDSRENRARQLNSPLKWASECGGPLIVVGDFNEGADSMLFHAIRNGNWHTHQLAMAHEHWGAKDSLTTSFATYAARGRRYRIDHVVYSHEYLILKGVYDLLTFEEKESMFGVGLTANKRSIPDDNFPSDHMPIGACFEIRNGPLEELPPELTETRKAELIELADEFVLVRPNSRPSPAEIEHLRAAKMEYNMWLCSLDEHERYFVRDHKKRGSNRSNNPM